MVGENMLKWVNQLFPIGPEFTIEEHEEFEKTRKEFNIKRCITISEAVLILNLVLIFVDQTFYKPMRGSTPAYTYLFYSHIVVSILIILWLLIMYLINSNVINLKYTLMYHVLVNIVIYWGVFMGLNSLSISGQITSYIICALSMSIVVYLCPIEGFIMYFSSLIIFISSLFLFSIDKKILYSHIVNASIAILCSYIASNINYSALKKDFLSKKIILNSKKDLEEINVKLTEYEKLRTDFFANISHEIRTPLNIIYSSQQMIESILSGINESHESNGRISKYLKMMKQNSLRLIRLVSNLIDMTKIDATIYSIRPMNCDIVGIVEDIVMSTAGYIESRGISLIFDTEVEEKIISCDPEKIERIMLNLLSNSVKFTDINGSIFVNIYLKDNNINISVRDTGIGIPYEMKEQIFNRFVQVDKSIDRNRNGSGIGLSLVKSLVEMHNGNISVNSNLGQGSEFIVSLPDILTDSNCRQEYINSLDAQRGERISIEFSDIYE
jgi:signal transduction histidine kinase